MPQRLVALSQDLDGGRRRQKKDIEFELIEIPGVSIAPEGPGPQLTASLGKRPVSIKDHGGVGKLVEHGVVHRNQWAPGMQWAAGCQPFLVQPFIDFRRTWLGHAERRTVVPGEGFGLLAAAMEARPVTCCKRGHLVEKEEFRPAGLAARPVPSHRLALVPLEVAYADEPRFGRPVLVE